MKRIKPSKAFGFYSLKFWRVDLVLFSIFLFGVIVIGRLAYIQIIQGSTYKALAKGQQRIFRPVLGDRGNIFLHNKNSLVLLATDKEGEFCYLSPKKIKDKEQVAEKLSDVLGLSSYQILNRINHKGSLFEVIKHNLTKEEIQKLKKLNLDGVYLGSETLREYPLGSLAGKVVGFVGPDGKGQYGIEGYWQKYLSGKEGYPFSEKVNRLPQRGSDLVLTIDYNIQYQAKRLLEQAHKDFNIKSGQIIVMDPQTGKVIAMSSFPDFNPNRYYKYIQKDDLDSFQNSSVQKLFEPGSMFKTFTMAAAIDQGKITPNTSYVDKGFVKFNGYTIHNYGMRAWGKRTMTEVLEKSINTGAVFAESQISHKVFLNYIKRFGFFSKTGIDLQGESFSTNEGLKNGREIHFATAAFGQGIEMTPINLIRAYCAIANGGRLLKPYVVEEIRKSNGEIIKMKPVVMGDNIISRKTASQLTAMLVSAVENGFCKNAKISGYYVAGKTGTAQIPFASLGIDKRGYSKETWQSFAGFAPAFNPKFVILVKLDNPSASTAEYSAVPIFQKLAKYIIEYWQIPPDRKY